MILPGVKSVMPLSLIKAVIKNIFTKIATHDFNFWKIFNKEKGKFTKEVHLLMIGLQEGGNLFQMSKRNEYMKVGERGYKC
jgi:hypothetical protein